MKSIKIINPSDEPLVISIFLNNNPINKAQELNDLFQANETVEIWRNQLLNY